MRLVKDAAIKYNFCGIHNFNKNYALSLLL
jgi:hypothetical protein